jgi:hypothetical protein
VPIARYFIFVGGTLAALLFIADWYLPISPPMFANHQHDIDRTMIRIKSAHKWPEKIVLDTSHPTITPPAVDEAAATQAVPPASDAAGNHSNLEAMAQLKPDTQSAPVDRPTSQVKRGVAKIARSKRGTTCRLARAEPDTCCQFGWIDIGPTTANAMPRREAALSWRTDWHTLTGATER